MSKIKVFNNPSVESDDSQYRFFANLKSLRKYHAIDTESEISNVNSAKDLEQLEKIILEIKNQIILCSKNEIIEIVNEILEKIFYLEKGNKNTALLQKEVSKIIKSKSYSKQDIAFKLNELKELITESEYFSFELTEILNKKLNNE